MSVLTSLTLDPIETDDPFLRDALEKVAELAKGTEAAKELSEVKLYVPDYRSSVFGNVTGRLYTANCQALLDENAIILNAAYLFETEAAVRSFGLSTSLWSIPYLRSDEDLFRLVELLRDNPDMRARRMREPAGLIGGGDADARDGFAMLLLFLVGHELGHLRQRQDARGFGAFVERWSPVASDLNQAVLKLARHARELAFFGFDLPGFEKAIDESSAIGQDQAQRRAAYFDQQLDDDRSFGNETDADDHAISFVQQVLDRIAAVDPDQADRLLVLLVNALFATALYHWYRDFGDFLHKLGIYFGANAQMVTFKMMENRDHYIHASELFGPVHRLTLLRAILAIDALRHARGEKSTTLGNPARRIAPVPVLEPLEADLADECTLREYLLRFHIDTAVKIATFGCASGWMAAMDEVRGTQQIFMMQFESIDQSVERLKRHFSLV